MQIREIIKTIEKFAPPKIAWEKDNVGLQVGNPDNEIKKVFLTLDLNHQALKTAIKNKCNFIITHHPLIFNSLKKLNFSNDEKSLLLQTIIKHDLTVFSVHTNLDFAKDGVSFQLAKQIGLSKIDFLEKNISSKLKLVTFLPENYADIVLSELFNAGAGNIGEYSNCSFKTNGKGSFIGSDKSNPKIGTKGNFEIVNEVRIEVVFDSWNIKKIENTLLKFHPYETPAFDIYKLENPNDKYGFGAVGELPKSMSSNEFLAHIKKNLLLDNFRYTIGRSKNIKKVAVCGGSGAELLARALTNNCDAFITSDIKYHVFQDAENKILLIDAGHFETEVFGLNVLFKLLKENFGEKIEIILNKKSTSPIKFFNN